MLTLLNELDRVINVQLQTIHVNLVLLFICTIQTHPSKASDKNTSRLPSERPVTSIISEYEVSVFRDVEETVTGVGYWG